MPRPRAERCLSSTIGTITFKPAGIPLEDCAVLTLGLDEAEALRLANLDGLYHEAAARSMGISRATFGRIINEAHRKITDALLNGKALAIEGGKVVAKQEGDRIMRVATPVRDGQIDEHFGHCQEYRIFRVEGNEVQEEAVLPSPGMCGCKSTIAQDLAARGVSSLIAGNMGDGAMRVLQSHGIKVVRGARGPVHEAVQAFARGELKDSGIVCASHAGHECQH